MKRILDNDWQEQLQESFEQPYYQQLRTFLKQEYAQQTIHPAMDHIYEALKLTPYHDVKVVILGQDPYHGLTKPTDCRFPYSRGSKYRLRCGIFTKN